MTHKLSLVVCILSAAALLAAILPLPYGYYTFLRLFIALAAVYVAYAGYRVGVLWLVLLFACLAVLFNPLAPVYLSKGVWQPINAGAAMAFMGAAVALKATPDTRTLPSQYTVEPRPTEPSTVVTTPPRPMSHVREAPLTVPPLAEVGSDRAVDEPPISPVRAIRSRGTSKPWTNRYRVFPAIPPEKRPYPEGLTHPTIRGDFVRSKAEALIANQLASMGIPYGYEVPLSLSGKTFYPDFTIQDKLANQTYYWEHSGSDEPDRRTAFKEKVEWYAANSIFGFQLGGGEKGTLIVTYDNQHKCVSGPDVDFIINTVILPHAVPDEPYQPNR